MLLPRKLLLLAWVVLTLAAYVLLLFTDWGNSYGGGTPLGTVVVDGSMVLGAFAGYEVFRTDTRTPVRAVAAAVALPLALSALLTFWLSVERLAGL